MHHSLLRDSTHLPTDRRYDSGLSSTTFPLLRTLLLLPRPADRHLRTERPDTRVAAELQIQDELSQAMMSTLYLLIDTALLAQACKKHDLKRLIVSSMCLRTHWVSIAEAFLNSRSHQRCVPCYRQYQETHPRVHSQQTTDIATKCSLSQLKMRQNISLV